MLILSLAFSKLVYGYYANNVFHFFQFFMYVILFCMLYFFIFWQFIISNTFYLLYVFFLSFKINIDNFGSKTWLENMLLDTKCSFHKWKIGIRPGSFMCWEIFNLYLLLSIIFTIFHSLVFFEFNNFFNNFYNAKCLASI